MKLSYLSQAWVRERGWDFWRRFAGFYLAFYYLEAFSGEASVRVGGHSGAVQRRGWNPMPELSFFSARWRWRRYRQSVSLSRRSIWAIFRCCSGAFRMLIPISM